jgi:hypothetical protein
MDCYSFVDRTFTRQFRWPSQSARGLTFQEHFEISARHFNHPTPQNFPGRVRFPFFTAPATGFALDQFYLVTYTPDPVAISLETKTKIAGRESIKHAYCKGSLTLLSNVKESPNENQTRKTHFGQRAFFIPFRETK